jgi:hypothetical protein
MIDSSVNGNATDTQTDEDRNESWESPTGKGKVDGFLLNRQNQDTERSDLLELSVLASSV